MYKRKLAFGLVTAMLGAVVACGGTNTPPPIFVPARIMIKPAGPTVVRGEAISYTVVRINKDLTETDVTDQVSWSTSTPATDTAIVSAGATTNTLAIGEVEVIARVSGLEARSFVTVTAQPIFLDVTPATLTVPLQREDIKEGDKVFPVVKETAQLTAMVYFEDGASEDVSGSEDFTWTVGQDDIIGFSGGTISGLQSGVTTVSASYAGFTGSSVVTVAKGSALEDIQIYPPSINIEYVVMDEKLATKDDEVSDYGFLLVAPDEVDVYLVNVYANHSVFDVTTDSTFVLPVKTPKKLGPPVVPEIMAPVFSFDGNTLVVGDTELESGKARSATVFVKDGKVTSRLSVSVTKTALESKEITAITADADGEDTLYFRKADEAAKVEGVATSLTLSTLADFPGFDGLDITGAELVKWTTSDDKVVDAEGVAVGIGNAILTVTLTKEDNTELKDTLNITVTAPPTPPLPVSLESLEVPGVPAGAPANEVTLAVGTRRAFKLMATSDDSAGNQETIEPVQDDAVYLTDNYGRMAFVINQADGMVTIEGIAPGSGEVTAYYGGETVKFDVTVTDVTLDSLAIACPNKMTGGETPAAIPDVYVCVATATFSDATTQDITDQVVWEVDGTNGYVTNGSAGYGVVRRVSGSTTLEVLAHRGALDATVSIPVE